MLNGCYSIARQALTFNWLDRIFAPDSLTLLGLHIHSTTYLKYVKCWRLNLINFVWDSSFIQQLEFLYYRLSVWISTNTPLVYLRLATLNVILNRYFIYRLFVMNYDLNVLFSKFKSYQLRPAGNKASYCKLSVVAASYAGFQAFWAMAGTWWTQI